MSNLSCATEANVDNLQSTNHRLSAFCALSSIVATFFFSFRAVQLIHRKSIFQSSTKIILYFNLFYVILHQIMYARERIQMLYKGLFLLDELCDWMMSEKDCVPYATLLHIGISGMVYSQTGLMIERAFVTFYCNYTTTISRVTGVSVSLTVLICSVSTYYFILWDDPLDGYSLSCFSPPKHSATRGSRFLMMCVLLTLLNLATSLSVMYYNKRLEYETRYKVKERFKKRETIDSTHTICIVSMCQFVTLFIYSFGLLILRLYRYSMSPSMFSSLVVWIYTLPYSALLLPLILIFRIHATKASRAQKIQDITSTRQTQEEYITQINQMWN